MRSFLGRPSFSRSSTAASTILREPCHAGVPARSRSFRYSYRDHSINSLCHLTKPALIASNTTRSRIQNTWMKMYHKGTFSTHASVPSPSNNPVSSESTSDRSSIYAHTLNYRPPVQSLSHQTTISFHFIITRPYPFNILLIRTIRSMRATLEDHATHMRYLEKSCVISYIFGL